MISCWVKWEGGSEWLRGGCDWVGGWVGGRVPLGGEMEVERDVLKVY